MSRTRLYNSSERDLIAQGFAFDAELRWCKRYFRALPAQRQAMTAPTGRGNG